MRSGTAITVCFPLVLYVAINAYAQSHGAGRMESAAVPSGENRSAAASTGGATAAGGISSNAAQVVGEHDVTAQVTKIDSATGMMTLNSAEGSLNLHFPPESLSDVKVGDTLTARLGFVRGPSGSAPPGGLHSKGVQLRGEHRMTGHVTVADRRTGKVSATTAEGPIDLYFPPPAVAILKKDDPITVYLAFTKEGEGEAISPSRNERESLHR